MNIKRYIASDMRHALQMIRDELGTDAVILETQRSSEGVEVSVAVDFDPALYVKPEPVAPARPAPAQPPAAEAQPAPAEPAAAPVNARDDSVRCLLEARLSRLIWDDMRARNPAATNIMRNLSRLGLTPAAVEQVMSRAPDLSTLDNTWSEPLKWLADSIPVSGQDLIMHGGVFAVAGPTGVGKTTSIAKLAARYALQNGVAGLALVSTDNYRIGAREQLETFARIIGAPVYSVPDAAQLDATLRTLSDKKLVLIDTAGMSQRDSRMVTQLDSLQRAATRIDVLLALPANVQTETAHEIVRVFASAQPLGCILTKVDEATSLGGVLSALMDARLPLAYICDGQRVPEDLHLAVQRLTWLVKTAMDCMREHSPRLGKDELAERFAKVAISA
ncbi:MAG: flagellar biosynthesis protein FlhF [Gammaproteobacteria bacterium]|jgi:flagellar biosynthesis protein FlhF|nr:flagellar biosynthesis protein FlhF [Gammaproteobacteria bacterium]